MRRQPNVDGLKRGLGSSTLQLLASGRLQVLVKPPNCFAEDIGPLGMLGEISREPMPSARYANQLHFGAGLPRGIDHQLRLMKRNRLVSVTVHQEERRRCGCCLLYTSD